MGQVYTQFSLEDRCEIARLQAEGHSLRQIAAALDRAPSSVARELKRNKGSKTYKPAYAEEQARSRRWTGCKLERKPQLRDTVLTGLRNGLSPEQVAGRLARDSGTTVISHETIYRFIYAQLTRTNDSSWRLYLPRAKSRRGKLGHRRGHPANVMKARVSIAERPQDVAGRSTPGHWETDLMMFAKYDQAVLTLHERTSRILIAQRPANTTSAVIADTLTNIMAVLPKPLRRTMTFDNGTEFARHFQLHDLSLKTYFCDTHSPWQKGGVENAIGRMRRFLPRKTDLATITEEKFNSLVAAYNNTPRKCLNFQTPAEVFIKQLLHFKCESISRLSTG